MERKVTGDQNLSPRNPNWPCPRARFGLLTDERGMKKLQVIREQYWQAKGE